MFHKIYNLVDLPIKAVVLQLEFKPNVTFERFGLLINKRKGFEGKHFIYLKVRHWYSEQFSYKNVQTIPTFGFLRHSIVW